MKKILITPRSYAKNSSKPIDMLKGAGYEVFFNPTGNILSESQMIEYSKDAVGIIVGVDPLSAKVMQSCPSLCAIAKYGVGTDNIDLPEAKNRDIKISVTQGANSNAVADYTFAMILAVARRLAEIDSACHNHIWNKLTSRDVYGKTLGIVGMGAIGKGVVKRSKGFDMKVLAFDPYFDPNFASQYGVTETTLNDICRQADFITLHLPLTQETRNIIGRNQLSLMKNTAILINTARGGLIDEEALLDALERDSIYGAGIDAFNEEPPLSFRWYDLKNVVMGSHCAASSVGAVDAMSICAAENLIRDLA